MDKGLTWLCVNLTNRSKSMVDRIIDNKILRDIVITELEKYRKLIVDQGLEGLERVDELIGILEADDDNGERLTET